MESKRLSSSDTFKSDHAPSFRHCFGKALLTTMLHHNGSSFSSSFPTHLLPHPRVVEVIRVHTDATYQLQGFSYSFREVIGAPLFTTAIVELSTSIVASGPIITDKDLKISSVDNSNEPEPAESQSFLRRYWWVIAGFLILSSLFGSQGQDSSSSASTEPSTSS